MRGGSRSRKENASKQKARAFPFRLNRNGNALAHGPRSRQASDARRSVSPLRRLTAAETEGYTAAAIHGGSAIQTIGMPGGRPWLPAGAGAALAGVAGAAWLHVGRPRSGRQ